MICSLFFQLSLLSQRLHLNNIMTNGHVHARTCRYSQFIWQLTWIAMGYNVQWLIPMHSLNDCEISMFTKTFVWAKEVLEWNEMKWNEKHNEITKSYFNFSWYSHSMRTTHTCTVCGDLFYSEYYNTFSQALFHCTSKFLSFKPFVECHTFCVLILSTPMLWLTLLLFFLLCIESKILFKYYIFNAERKKNNRNATFKLSHAPYILPD